MATIKERLAYRASRIAYWGKYAWGEGLRTGIFGRKAQVHAVLAMVPKAETGEWDAELCEKKRAEILSNYDEIRVHKLWSTRVGEFIPRCLNAIEDNRREGDCGVLHVYVCTDYINYNSRVTRIIARSLHMILPENRNFWGKTLLTFPKVEFIKYWRTYSQREGKYEFSSEDMSRYFQLTPEEEAEGQQKLEAMGISGDFVCVESRDTAYLNTMDGAAVAGGYNSVLVSTTDSMAKALSYLSENELTSVRVGRIVGGPLDFPGCIDYAHQYYDELMDIVLVQKAKFCLEDTHGINIFPSLVNTPLAGKNALPIRTPGLEAFPKNPNSLFILKKFYKTSERRFLSLREMLEFEGNCTVMLPGKAESKGVKIVDNSPEEIADLTREMNDRLDGTWMDTEEGLLLRRAFHRVLDEYYEKDRLPVGSGYDGHISTSFLLRNRFLLTEEDIAAVREDA